jgi:hypothetical protein
MRRAVGVLAVAALCVAAAACGDDDGDDGSAVAESMSAALQRSTLFETRRSLHLAVGYDGEAGEIEVATVQLDTPLFEPVDPQERDAVVPAGGRPVVMPLEFGPARCDGEDGDEDEGDGEDEGEPAVLVAGVGGEEVRVPLDQRPEHMLASLHEAECAMEAVRDEVDLRLGDTWERTGPRTVAGEVLVDQRRPGATVAIDEMEGNVIFFVHADDRRPWLEVSDGSPSARGEVEIEASRCDPHALTEYKRTFIFVAWVGIDGGDPVKVDVEAEGETQRILADLLAECIG